MGYRLHVGSETVTLPNDVDHAALAAKIRETIKRGGDLIDVADINGRLHYVTVLPGSIVTIEPRPDRG